VQTTPCRSFAELATRLSADMRRLEQRTNTGVRKAAREGRNHMARDTMPKAFGELIDSLDVTDTQHGSRITSNAPYSAAVEVGSRPHTPPIEPLIAWVKLRGMQGLQPQGRLRQLAGTTTTSHARAVASQLRKMERGGSLDVDAAEQVARAIQHAISEHGTKPTWFARRALPGIRDALDRFVRQELAKPL
jgi:hypothetical protein